MRITFLIIMGIERPSGRRYLQLARGLVSQGHHVRILALHPDLTHCMQRRFIYDGVEVWYVGQMHARKGGSVPERFGPLALLSVLIGSTLGMLWGVLCSPADVYHLGKPQPVNGLVALVAVRLLRHRPFYVDCDDDEVYGNRLHAPWQRAIFRFWQQLLPHLAEGVTVNTRHLVAELGGTISHRVVYVPNGVAPEQFTLPAGPYLTALRVSLGLTGCRVVAYVGTLALQNHPVDLLLEAWPAVIAAIPNAILLLIGGGEDLETLREQAIRSGLEANVRFTGHLSHAAVPAYLALADLSVDPVRDDVVARARSPLKLFESMALGVPVITGAVGDRGELLGEGSAGMLVEPGSAEALTTAMLVLLQDEPRRMQMVRAGPSQANRYNWNNLAQVWSTIYGRKTV